MTLKFIKTVSSVEKENVSVLSLEEEFYKLFKVYIFRDTQGLKALRVSKR